MASLGNAATTFVSTSHGDSKISHETTVHTTQGREYNIANPYTTHALQAEGTPAELAEAAAASAFEPFTPGTPLTTVSTTDTVFAPKISSTDVYSTASSPTGQYENMISPSATDTTKYETSTESKVFGSQDTSASSKRHSNEDLRSTKKTNKTR
jgi:hypothetical protein